MAGQPGEDPVHTMDVVVTRPVTTRTCQAELRQSGEMGSLRLQMVRMTLLVPRDPMGIYQILFAFASQTDSYIGEPDTRPMSQGFPLTTPIPGGPELPSSLEVDYKDRMYPKADGTPALRKAIADYYNRYYGCRLTEANVMMFAGGRPGLVALLWMLHSDFFVTIEETEYTPYWDMLKHCERAHAIVPSNEANRFRPDLEDHRAAFENEGSGRQLLLRSNPCNPTGVTLAL
ncbi:MAG: aminotransferase class I/II-fold pyridoxal phosphate-dependent enzyme, partial [Planctomycetota bacterium]